MVIERGQTRPLLQLRQSTGKRTRRKDSIDVRRRNTCTTFNFQINIEGFTAGVEATLLDKDGQPTCEEIKEYSLLVPEGVNIILQKRTKPG